MSRQAAHGWLVSDNPADAPGRSDTAVPAPSRRPCRGSGGGRLRLPHAALDDVAGDGHGSPSHLRCQAELLLLREGGRQSVDVERQLVGQFEGPQLRVVSHSPGVYSLQSKFIAYSLQSTASSLKSPPATRWPHSGGVALRLRLRAIGGLAFLASDLRPSLASGCGRIPCLP